jgi:two-component system, OmpR family, catabolic regulation response regulator CreB
MPIILIVEDEPTIAETLVFALQREGMLTYTTTLGQAALDYAKRYPIDLVLLDVGLPDLNGFEVCKSLRTFSDAPIIFLTARSDEIDRVVGLEIGADDYVVKPFSPREVVARVKVILKRRAAPVNMGVVTASTKLSIDQERATVSYNGISLDLARYEYLLLRLLAERPGKVYSRSEIMDALWPSSSGSMDRTVDTHIKTLRAKLRRVAPDDEPIQTHRGLGYSLQYKT